MRRIIYTVIPLFAFIHLSTAQYRTTTVAVLPFYDTDSKSTDSSRSQTVLSNLTESMYRYRFIKLVERAEMKKLLSEVELGMTGLIDEKTAAKVGKIHGVQVMILGNIGERITARAVHVETHKIIASASTASTAELEILGEKLASDIETYLAKENLKQLRNNSPHIDLGFWVERIEKSGRKRTLSFGDKGGVRIGERVIFHFRSNRTGYLTIVDIQPSGDVVVLFPNDLHPDNKILAGRMYSIPSESDGFDITVSEPTGTDTLVAFFTVNSVDWLDLKKLNRNGFWTVKKNEKLALSRGFSITATKLKRADWESITLEMNVQK